MRPLSLQLLHNLEANARELARAIDEGLTEARGQRTGFALLVFSFMGSELTWISNAPREDMIRVVEELLARWKAGTADELSRPKGSG